MTSNGRSSSVSSDPPVICTCKTTYTKQVSLVRHRKNRQISERKRGTDPVQARNDERASDAGQAQTHVFCRTRTLGCLERDPSKSANLQECCTRLPCRSSFPRTRKAHSSGFEWKRTHTDWHRRRSGGSGTICAEIVPDTAPYGHFRTSSGDHTLASSQIDGTRSPSSPSTSPLVNRGLQP